MDEWASSMPDAEAIEVDGRPLIRLHPRRVISFGLDEDRVERVTDRASAIAGKTSIVVTAFYDAVVQRATSFAAMKDALTA